MIIMKHGNILNDKSDAIVNPVNTVGAMGKGLAKEFKLKYPDMYANYRQKCLQGEFTIGTVLSYRCNDNNRPFYIINFPTKDHYNRKSSYEYIDVGLQALKKEVEKLELSSIAIPALGCGLGGLKWNVVSMKIFAAFNCYTPFTISKCKIYLYNPKKLI